MSRDEQSGAAESPAHTADAAPSDAAAAASTPPVADADAASADAASAAVAAASSPAAAAALPARPSSRTRTRPPIVDADSDADGDGAAEAAAASSDSEDEGEVQWKPSAEQATAARAQRLSQRLAARSTQVASASSSDSHTDDEDDSPRAKRPGRSSHPRRLSSLKRPLSKSEKKARKMRKDDQADAQLIEDEYDVATLRKSAAAEAAGGGEATSSRPRRSTRKSERCGGDMSDDDAEISASGSSGSDSSADPKKSASRASSSGRPSRRAAAKSASLNEESLFRHSIVATAAAPRTENLRTYIPRGRTPGTGWKQRRRFLSEAGLISPEDEEEEEESSSEEELTPDQEAVWQRLQDRAPQLILAIRNNPEQAARLAKEAEEKKAAAAAAGGEGTEKKEEAKLKEESAQPMEIDEKSSPSPAPASASASASGPVVITLSDSDDDEERKSTSGGSDSAKHATVKKEEEQEEEEEIIYQFLVKWAGMGYLHCEWIDEAVLNRFERGYDMIGRWLKRQSDGKVDMSEWDEGVFFPQSYLEVERIVARRGPKMTPQKAIEMLDNSREKEATKAISEASAKATEASSAAEAPPPAAAATTASKPKRQSARHSKQAAAADSSDADPSEYLVKWRDLAYDECTWESRRSIADDSAIRLYWERSQLKSRGQPKPREDPLPPDVLQTVAQQVGSIRFNNPDFALRSYQLEGVSWMAFNWMAGRTGQILADEMGLGKTIQVVSFCKWLFQYQDVRGPFLIVAPLSTLPHWVREFAQTELNVVTMPNTADAREVFKKYELDTFEVDGSPTHVRGSYRFDVIVTAYTSVMSESLALGKIPWKLIVVDEAQRAKGISSKLTTILQGSLHYEHALLLTGTPLQNNLTELWSLLHIIAPKVFPKLAPFLEEYGTLTEMGQITELHSKLRPFLLRRLKEDVEKGLPPRTEIVIECEMTLLQKQFYRAIYEENSKFLTQLTGPKAKKHKKKGKRGDDDADLDESTQKVSTPSLMNIAMQLRHVCNHPYAIKGNTAVETSRIAAIKAERRKAGLSTEGPEVDALVMRQLIESSGKFVLLSKLLPKLRSQGHRVLIFSQFKKILDILEDVISWLGMTYERLDGNVTGNQRQAAIDRFSAKDSDRFIFLLSTKAGGVGVNLMAADTVIIFDSDWNPQNDIQAQARAHRIGQVKPVKIYRLITRGTYEQVMFEKSSLKLGLDHAVLKSYTNSSKEGAPVLRRDEIETMLRKGAYHVFLQNSESTQLTEDDIDVILKRDAHVVQYKPGGGAIVDATQEGEEQGNDGPMLGTPAESVAAAASAAPQPSGSSSFSKASFVLNGEMIDIQSADFWDKVGLKAAPEEAPLPRIRQRKSKQNYNEDSLWQKIDSTHAERRLKKKHGRRPKGSDDEAFDSAVASSSDSSESSSSSDSASNSDSSARNKPAKRPSGGAQPQPQSHSSSTVVSPYAISVDLALALYDALELTGYNRWDTLRARVNQRALNSDEIRSLDPLTDEGLKYFALGVIKQNMLLAPVGTPFTALSAAARAAIQPGTNAVPSTAQCHLAGSLDFLQGLAILRDAETMVGRYASLAETVIAAKMEEVRIQQAARNAAARAAIELQQAMVLHAVQQQQRQLAESRASPMFQLQQKQQQRGPVQPPVPAPAQPSAPPVKSDDILGAASSLPARPPGSADIRLHVCAQCRKTGIALSKCGRCQCVAYCSRECQMQAWQAHKPLCKQWAADPAIQAHAQYARAVLAAKEANTAKSTPASSMATVAPASVPAVALAAHSPSKSVAASRCPKNCHLPANGEDIPCEILGITEGSNPKYVVHWAGYSRDPLHPDTTEQAIKPWNDTYPEMVREWKAKEAAEEEEEERQKQARKQVKMEKKKKWLADQKELAPPKPKDTTGQSSEAAAAAPAPAVLVAAAAPSIPTAHAAEKETAMSDVSVPQTGESAVAASSASPPAATAAAAHIATAPAAVTSDAAPAVATSPVDPLPANNNPSAHVDSVAGSSAAAPPAPKPAAEVIDLSADPSASPPAAAAAASGSPATISNSSSIPEHLRTAGLPLGFAFVREMQVHPGFLSRPAGKPEAQNLSAMLADFPVDPVLSHPELLKRIGARQRANGFLQSMERVHVLQQFVAHDNATGQWRFEFPQAFLQATWCSKLSLIPECAWWNTTQRVLESGTLDLRRDAPDNRHFPYDGNVDPRMPHDADLLLAVYLKGFPDSHTWERERQAERFTNTLSLAPHYTAIRSAIGDGTKRLQVKAWGNPVPPTPVDAGAGIPPLQDQFGNLQAPPPPPKPVFEQKDSSVPILLPTAYVLQRRVRALVQSLVMRGFLDRKLPFGHRPALTAEQANAARRGKLQLGQHRSLHDVPASSVLTAAGSAPPPDRSSSEHFDFSVYSSQRMQINAVLVTLAERQAQQRKDAEAAERKRQAEQLQRFKEEQARRIEEQAAQLERERRAREAAQAAQLERERRAREAAQAEAEAAARRATAAEIERQRVVVRQQIAARAAEQLRQQQLAAQRNQARALFQRQMAAQVSIAQQAAAQHSLSHNTSVQTAAEAVKKQIAEENAKAAEEIRRLMAEIEEQMATKQKLAQERAAILAMKAKLAAGDDGPAGAAAAAASKSGSSPSKHKRKHSDDDASDVEEVAPKKVRTPEEEEAHKLKRAKINAARRAKKIAKQAEEKAGLAVAAYAASAAGATAPASDSRASAEHKSATNPSAGAKRKAGSDGADAADTPSKTAVKKVRKSGGSSADTSEGAAASHKKKQSRSSTSKDSSSDSEGEDRSEEQRQQSLLRGKAKFEAQIAAMRAQDDARRSAALAAGEQQHHCRHCGHLSRSAYLRVQHEQDCVKRPRAEGEEESKAEGGAAAAASVVRAPAASCPDCGTGLDRRRECPNPRCLKSPSYVPEFKVHKNDKSMRCTAFPCSYVATTAPDGTLECPNPKCVSVSAIRRRARMQAAAAAGTPEPEPRVESKGRKSNAAASAAPALSAKAAAPTAAADSAASAAAAPSSSTPAKSKSAHTSVSSLAALPLPATQSNEPRASPRKAAPKSATK